MELKRLKKRNISHLQFQSSNNHPQWMGKKKYIYRKIIMYISQMPVHPHSLYHCIIEHSLFCHWIFWSFFFRLFTSTLIVTVTYGQLHAKDCFRYVCINIVYCVSFAIHWNDFHFSIIFIWLFCAQGWMNENYPQESLFRLMNRLKFFFFIPFSSFFLVNTQ